MRTRQKLLALLGSGLALFALVIPLIACGLGGANSNNNAGSISPGGDAIANEAVNLANHLFGNRANLYNPLDIPGEYNYWTSLATVGTSLWNSLFAPGSLQCVSFVTGVFAAAKDPLPAQGNAIDFWSLYANRPGWQEINNGEGDPQVGDMVVWSTDTTSSGEPGHIAIVVGVNPPSTTQPGSVTVGEANAPTSFYTMTWGVPNRAMTSGYVDTWPGFTVKGFIRQTTGRPANITPVPLSGGPVSLSGFPGMPSLTTAQSTYALQALKAAAYYQLPTPSRFVIQLDNESGLNPNVGTSTAGAVGIAQFEPGTAAGIPLCSVSLTNPLNCKGGGSINPLNPTQAINGAAYYMHQLYTDFLGVTSNSDQAYAYAIGAYNAGEGTISADLDHCTSAQWIQCLPTETSKYVNCIMGYDHSQCNFRW
jgi:CHAP domain/Transglycosylase SLT domain